jgi:hypothetical protein
MAQIEIDKWLSAPRPSFKSGVYLHNTFARPHERISASLLKADTSISRKKLRQSLERISERQNKPPEPEKETTTFTKGHKWGNTEGYPRKLVEMDRQLPLLTSQINALANTTLQYDEGDGLRDIALSICRLVRERAEMWQILDFYATHGVAMPGTITSDEEDLITRLVDWLDRQPALIDYTRRYKGSADPRKMAEVRKRNNELDRIRTFIKAHQHD